MELVHALGFGTRESRRAVQILVALVLLFVAAYGLTQLTHRASHEGRCQELLTSESRSAYIGFEIEGCRAEVRPRARSVVSL